MTIFTRNSTFRAGFLRGIESRQLGMHGTTGPTDSGSMERYATKPFEMPRKRAANSPLIWNTAPAMKAIQAAKWRGIAYSLAALRAGELLPAAVILSRLPGLPVKWFNGCIPPLIAKQTSPDDSRRMASVLPIVQQTSIQQSKQPFAKRLDCIANRRGNAAPPCADPLESKANKPAPRQAVKRDLWQSHDKQSALNGRSSAIHSKRPRTIQHAADC